ncbi:MAG: right-handed parallel beta-helix repeat-containing protein [Steroidobacteraceae bacterium]
MSGSTATVRSNYVKVNNSGIRGESPGSGAVVSLNEVARPDSGHTTTFDGILFVGSATNVLIDSNLTRDQAGGGIELGFGGGSLTNVTVQNNSVSNNGYASGSTPSSEPLGLVGYWYGGTNVLLYRNRISGHCRPRIARDAGDQHTHQSERLQKQRQYCD